MNLHNSADSPDMQQRFNNGQKQTAKEIFKLQRRAFKQAPFPDETLRKQQLLALKQSLVQHKDKLVKAISADFGCRSFDETLLADILPTLSSIDYAIKHLREWMKPEKRSVSSLFQPAKARVIAQPLGVVGIISPWNYPVYLSLGPLVAAIAAGNRVMLKPSEFTPYSNRVLSKIIEETFSRDEVFMIEGDASVASSFAKLPFNHLLFTGSTKIGKKIMAAAAKNLTPVTLELGGKSPVIIAPDVSVDFAAERILYGKCLNAGQTCVAPDYILCPQDKLEELIAALKKRFNEFYPDISNGDYSSVINQTHLERLQDWLKDAIDKGATAIPLAETSSSRPHSMPLQLITQVNSSMTLMQEEIFGPLLPIIGYKDLKQACKIVYSFPRPLALYLFTHSHRLEEQILRHTHAGGVCINDTVSHVAQDDLPFGGIGASGMGCYHAHEGFLTFSKAKSVFKRGRFNSAKLAYPPYNRWIHRLIYRWFIR